MKALISVSNKTNITTFANNLQSLGYEIVSTGGTYQLLKDNNINVIDISEITSYNSSLNTIIKTLYPEIYASVALNFDDPNQTNQLKSLNLTPFDMVVVNLNPLDDYITKDCNPRQFFENLDIGGPTFLRSAAKNYLNIIVICDYNDYDIIINELKDTGQVSLETRIYLMKKVFKNTRDYEEKINNYLNKNY